MNGETPFSCTLLINPRAPEDGAPADQAWDIPNVGLYREDEAAMGWLALSHGKSYRLSSGFQARLDMLDKRALAGGADALDIISIGPGDGGKDVPTVALLTQTKRIARYLAIDISQLLLLRTFRNLAAHCPTLRNGVSNLLVSDITDPSTFEMIAGASSGAPAVWLFFGNTLGNLPDDLGFLAAVARAMKPGDRLLLEVRVALDTTPPSDGDPLLRKHWQFQPLKDSGAVFDADRFSYTYRPDTRSVPGTMIRRTYYDTAGTGDPLQLLTVRYYAVDALIEHARQSLGLQCFAHSADDCAALLLLGR